MKKTRIALCAMLALVVAFACFAFAGCGDEITATTPATEDSYKAFIETAALKSAADTETGMPGFISGNGYKLEMNMSMKMEQPMGSGSDSAKMSTEISYKADGQLNMLKDMTGSVNVDIDFNIKTTGVPEEAGGDGEIAMTISGDSILADDTLYINGDYRLSGSGTETKTSTKVAMTAESVLNGFEAIISETPGADAAATLDEYVKALNAQYGDGEDSDVVTVFIDGGTLKVEIDKIGHIAISYDEDGVLTAADMVLDDISSTLGASSESGSMTGSFTYKIRKTDVTTVTAPSDAADYELIDMDI